MTDNLRIPDKDIAISALLAQFVYFIPNGGQFEGSDYGLEFVNNNDHHRKIYDRFNAKFEDGEKLPDWPQFSGVMSGWTLFSSKNENDFQALSVRSQSSNKVIIAIAGSSNFVFGDKSGSGGAVDWYVNMRIPSGQAVLDPNFDPNSPPPLPPSSPYGMLFGSAYDAAIEEYRVQKYLYTFKSYIQSVINANPGAEFYCTGHSLGGYLCKLAMDMFPEHIKAVYAANSPNVDQPPNTPFDRSIIDLRVMDRTGLLTNDIVPSFGTSKGIVVYLDTQSFGIDINVGLPLIGGHGVNLSTAALLRIISDADGTLLPATSPRANIVSYINKFTENFAGEQGRIVVLRERDGDVRIEFPEATVNGEQRSAYSLTLPTNGSAYVGPSVPVRLVWAPFENGGKGGFILDYGNAPPSYYLTDGQSGTVPIDPDTGRPVGASTGATADQLREASYGTLYPNRDPATATVPPPMPSTEQLQEIVVARTKLVFPGLSNSQVDAINDLRKGPLREFFGPQLEAALVAGDKWLSFERLISGDLPPSFGVAANDAEQAVFRRDFQLARLELARKFSPFSGNGGVPASKAEALSVLGKYDDATVGSLGTHLKTMSLSPGDIAALVDSYFPLEAILADPALRADPEVMAALLAAGRRIERIFTGLLGVKFEIAQLRALGAVVLPHIPDGDMIIPLTSNGFYDPSRVLTIGRAVGVIGPLFQDGKYSVTYGDLPPKYFDTEAQAQAYVASDAYRLRPDGTSLSPAEAIIVEGQRGQAPSSGGNGETPFDETAGKNAFTALTIIASRIASQQFGVRDPYAAILLNIAVQRATEEVVHTTLQSLNLIKPWGEGNTFQLRLADGLKTGVTSGLTSLVTSQVMARLLAELGVEGVPADAITSVASSTASHYVLHRLGMTAVTNAQGQAIPASLRGSFSQALESAPATITANIVIDEVFGINNQTAKMAGNMAASLMFAFKAGGPGGIYAAAAMVAVTVIFDVIGIGVDPDGPIGKVNLVPSGGRFVAQEAYVERNDFEGPAEQLTMVIESQMFTAIQTLNTALEAVDASVTSLGSGRTGLRFYLKTNSYRSIVNGQEKYFGELGVNSLLINFIERTLAGANLAIPPSADPIVAKALRRGWYDWAIYGKSPEFRQRLPASDTVFALYDAVGKTYDRGGSGSGRPSRPPVGTPEEIVLGMLAATRGAAAVVRATYANYIQRRSQNQSTYGIGSLDCFDEWATAVTLLQTLGEETGYTFPAVPEPGYPSGQLDNDNVPAYVQERLGQVLHWRALTETPPIATGQSTIQQPTDLTLTATPDPSVQVSWQPVGVDEQVALQWQEEGGLWSSDKVDSGASKLMLPAVQPGRTYKVQAQRLAAPVSGVRRASAWTPTQTVTVPTGLEGARVARLELSQQGTDTTWEGRDVQINWSGIFPAVAGSADAFATSAVPATSPHLHGYGIRILTADGRLLREVGPVLETGYTYRYEDNLDDSRAKGLPSASRELRFEVSILPKVGPAVGMQALTVTNDAPPKVGVVATAGVGLLSVQVTPVEDLDLDGYAIWISDQPGFDPASVAPTYRGPSPQVVQRNLVLGNWYIRAAAVDMFQPRGGLDVAGLNLSDEVMVTLADITVDTVPPAVPTGLTLTSDISFTSGREQVVTLTATWDRNGEADFLVYEGQIRRGEDGEWTDFSLGLPAMGAPSHVWRVEAGTPYAVRVRGRDRSSNVSDYSAAVSIISAVDTLPPGTVSAVVADVGLRSVILRWTNPPDLDLDMVELFRAAANDRAQALRIGSVRGSVFADQGLSPGSTWHYWLRAVDRTGNAGDWSHGDTAGLAVAIPRATADDIADAQLNFAKFAQGIEPVGMVDALPTPAGYTGPRTVMLTGDGKLYRLVANAWTAAVAAGDVAGQLASHQIAADAITAGKIAVGAVNAREIAAGAINAERIAAGAILANHITANAVRAEHIQAGAVTADSIAVANLAAVSANLGTITAGSLGVNVAYAGQIEAGQIKAGTVLSDSVIVGGTALSAIRANASLGASDPAYRINSGSTTINGGKIETGSIDASAIKAGSIDTSRLKVSGRILSISGLNISFNGSNVQWTASVLRWTDDSGDGIETALLAGQGEAPIGQRLRLYWEPGATALTLTANSSINPSASASILATIQRGALVDPIRRHHQDVVIKGNKVTAGAVDANVIRTDMLDAREIRMGVTVDGEAGIYMRTTDNGNVVRVDGTTEDGAREGQRTIFASSVYLDSSGRSNAVRRAQFFVSADGTDAGFEAWDSTGKKIFGSNGFGTGSVDARVIRPESATFVRSCVARDYAEISVVIAGLKPGDNARVVLMAYGNGNGAPLNTLLQVRGHGLASAWASDSNNYSGFKGDAQGAFMKSFPITANGTYGWQCWCSDGESDHVWPSAAFFTDIAGKSTTRLPRDVGLIALVSLR